MESSRHSGIVSGYVKRVDVLRQKVQQETLRETLEHLRASTPSECFSEEEAEFDGYQIGFFDAIL